jgi:hypothetical protein
MAVPRGAGSLNDHFKSDLSPMQTAIRVLFSLGLTVCDETSVGHSILGSVLSITSAVAIYSSANFRNAACVSTLPMAGVPPALGGLIPQINGTL